MLEGIGKEGRITIGIHESLFRSEEKSTKGGFSKQTQLKSKRGEG
jgi:hypothetical protein